MKKVAELRAEKEALRKKGLGILDEVEAEDREPTEAEAKELDGIQARCEEIDAECAKLEANANRRRALEGSTALTGNGEAARRPHGQYADLSEDPAQTGGFKSIVHFASAVRGACQPGGTVDPLLASMIGSGKMAAPTNFHEGGGSNGEGFELPVQYRNDIFEVMEGVDEFGPIVDEEPTAARKVEALSDESTPWGSSGVQANWRSEGTQMDPSKIDTADRTITLHEIYAFVLATGELLADAPRMASRLTRKAGEALSWKKNSAMMDGTGAGQPLGWMKSNALITVPKESGQDADTIVALNVLNMVTRLSVVPGDMPLWLANRNVIPQLATMTIGDRPVWMPPSGLAAAPGGFLMGMPVRFTEHAKTVGDLGDLQLLSPKGYYSLRRDSGPEMARSIHLYFDYNIEAFRWMMRFGGQPHLSAPINAPTAGGGAANSKSHFVALAERA